MKTSQAGIQALEDREGVRTQAYQDVRGIWTIGVGHTGPEVHQGLVWSAQQVADALAHDIGWAEDEVNRTVYVPMTQNQFDALVSFVFNIGKTGFDHSSALRDFNSGVIRAANDLLMWEQPPVLKGRRESERAQFLKKD
jgi:lysozyme